MKIMNTLALGESLKIASPKGNQAKGDTGLSNCTMGLIIFMIILLVPINNPKGIATRLPNPKPIPTRASELNNFIPMPLAGRCRN